MANSYIAVPNVLPGNVTIGGNLTVGGDVLRVGSVAPYLRLEKASANNGMFSYNWNNALSARDVANFAYIRSLITTLPQIQDQLANAAGAFQSESQPTTMFTDYTNHANTGNTTENTLYTKTIRANLLGPNGALRVTVGLHVAVQGVTGTTIRVKLGATSYLVATVAAADAVGEVIVQGYIFNQNSASVQAAHGFKYGGAGTTPCGDTAGAINTAADAVFSVTAQNGTASDSQTFNFISVEQLNTYGPVT